MSWMGLVIAIIGIWLALKVVGVFFKLAMWALVLVGGYFLIRGFVRLSKAIVELRTAMTDLADAGAALNSVQDEVSRLGATIDESRRQ